MIYQDQPLGKGLAVRDGSPRRTVMSSSSRTATRVSVDDYAALLEPIERGEASFVLGSRHVRGKPMRHFAESRGTSVLLNVAHWCFTGLFDLTYGVGCATRSRCTRCSAASASTG